MLNTDVNSVNGKAYSNAGISFIWNAWDLGVLWIRGISII
jgi:hypothetical protein